MKKSKNIINGSRIIIETLIEQGVTEVFGYPGGQVLGIYDELFKAEDRIKHYLTAHEQGAAHAADGYSRVTGKVGVVIATSGPGATNLVTGLATAMLDSVPMVAITGNVSAHLIGKDSFQEIDITGVTLPITKHNFFVTNACEIADTIREAFKIAKSGRPGPVLVDITKNAQEEECEFENVDVVEPFVIPKATDEDISKAVKLINNSKRPYIYVGGGAAGAGMTKQIMALAEKIDAYVGCSLMGLSVMPNSFDRFLGMQGMHGRYASSVANRQADLVIGVGVRFSDRATGDPSKYSENAKIIQLDTDVSEINKNVTVDVGIIGDISDSFERILQSVDKKSHTQWKKQVERYKYEGQLITKESEKFSSGAITPKRVFDIINEVKGKQDIIVTDVGQNQMWTAQFANFESKRRFASSGGLGTMGYGLGAAIGAHIATGDKTILITGDGSFGMNLNELATAVSYNSDVIIVLMNNGALGMVKQWQTLFYEKRYSNTILERKTDFVKLAEAFGAYGVRTTTMEEFECAFKEAYTQGGPSLIEVMISKDELVLPMLPPGASIEGIITRENEEKQ